MEGDHDEPKSIYIPMLNATSYIGETRMAYELGQPKNGVCMQRLYLENPWELGFENMDALTLTHRWTYKTKRIYPVRSPLDFDEISANTEKRIS